jgi:DNA-binding transcriptional LysR family regulator
MKNGWLGVEIRYLAALRAVAQEESFGRAAERLGYTQSAISQQIGALERIVGRRLVERAGGRRAVSLTEAGRVLLEHAIAIEARVQAARADMAALDDGTAGLLRLGTYQSVGARLLPRVMREYASDWPGVEIRLHEAASDDELLGLVQDGALDVTFALLPLPEGPFSAVELMRDPYMLVVAAGEEVDARDLTALPLVGFRGCRNEERVEAELRLLGVDTAAMFRSDDNATIQALAAEGGRAALMPRLTIDLHDPRTRAVDLDGLVPARVLGLAWHRDRSLGPHADAFVESTAALCARLGSGMTLTTNPAGNGHAEAPRSTG